jgi:hypothetical protein
MDFLAEIRKSIIAAKEIPMISELTDKVEELFNRISEIALVVGKATMSERAQYAYAFAHPFLEVIGDLCMAWMLLWRASVAAPKLEKLAGGSDPETIRAKAEKNKDAAFYEGQLQTARYFIKSVVPVTMGKLNAIEVLDGAAVEMLEPSFGSR